MFDVTSFRLVLGVYIVHVVIFINKCLLNLFRVIFCDLLKILIMIRATAPVLTSDIGGKRVLVLVHSCTNAQMHKCTNAQMHKCTNAQMHK